MRYSEKKVEAARNFANKLWNATRFVLMNLPEDFQPGLPSEDKLDMSDKWVLTKLNQVAGAMSDNLDHYDGRPLQDQQLHLGHPLRLVHRDRKALPELGDAEQADTAAACWCMLLTRPSSCCTPSRALHHRELYQGSAGSAETIMTRAGPPSMKLTTGPTKRKLSRR